MGYNEFSYGGSRFFYLYFLFLKQLSLTVIHYIVDVVAVASKIPDVPLPYFLFGIAML